MVGGGGLPKMFPDSNRAWLGGGVPKMFPDSNRAWLGGGYRRCSLTVTGHGWGGGGYRRCSLTVTGHGWGGGVPKMDNLSTHPSDSPTSGLSSISEDFEIFPDGDGCVCLKSPRMDGHPPV